MTARTPRRRLHAAALLALAALAAWTLTAVPAASAATAVTLSATGGAPHTSFTAPNQITVTPTGGTASASLTPGVTSRVVLGSVGISAGAHPGGICAPSSFSDQFDLSWTVTVSGATRTIVVPYRLKWICNNQAQFDHGTGSAARVTLPLNATTDLVVSIAEQDAYADGLQSGQFPSFYNGGATVRADLLLLASDTSAPQIDYTLTPPRADGDNGWYKSTVALDWAVTEPESASSLVLTGCQDRQVSTDQGPTTYSCSASSDGGAAGPVTLTIKRDATAPTIAGTLSPATPDGQNGWYTSRPTASWTCGDATSGVRACSSPTTASEGTAALTGTAVDQAGNSATANVGPVSVDLTNPRVDCTAGRTFVLGEPGAVVSATVTDGGSGPVQGTVTAPARTDAVGTHTATVTGTDRAGRTTTASCSYTVGYGFLGFFQPVDNTAVNVARAGQAIPLKWRVVDHAGAGVTTLTDVSVTVAARTCDVGSTPDELEEYATGSSGLQNLGGGYYQLNWATPKSYAGSCKTLRLDIGDGRVRTAEFSFR